MKNSFSSSFIKQHRQFIIDQCYINAKRLKKDAEILMKGGAFASAHTNIIEALEEIAKAKKLENPNFNNYSELIKHDKKAIEIMQVSAQQYRMGDIGQSTIDWAQNRIPQMREDATYVRLKPTQNNQIAPDNKYWRKRAKDFYKFLSDILK